VEGLHSPVERVEFLTIIKVGGQYSLRENLWRVNPCQYSTIKPGTGRG